MKIAELVEKSLGFVICPDEDGLSVEISGVEYDSRKAAPGSLFVAVMGYESDGHSFVRQAIEKGAAAVMVSDDRYGEFRDVENKGVIILTSSDTRRALSMASSVFFRNPSSKMHITGVTGTNGKTSFTYLLESVFQSQGIRCGVMGTVNYRWPGNEVEAPNTTPESRDIQEMLKKMYDSGVTHVVMEVSSHALELSRVIDVNFNTAVFTNLTGEHLDFHGDMETYFSAKNKLFQFLAGGDKPGRTAVLNVDDDYSVRIGKELRDSGVSILNYGVSMGADILAENSSVKNLITGLAYKLEFMGNTFDVSLGVAGRFQLYNSLAAFGAAVAAGMEPDAAVSGIEKLVNVPGRLEVIDSSHGFFAVVDYAHTSDALLKLLQSVKEMEHSRIITVFGCGGDRDRKKRPEMGRIAVEYSDFAIVTSDNPRTENPDAIIEDVLKGIERENYAVEPDRERAIERAVSMAEANDIIVIAGKGHENYQIMGREKIHFDDRETASRFINERPSL